MTWLESSRPRESPHCPEACAPCITCKQSYTAQPPLLDRQKAMWAANNMHTSPHLNEMLDTQKSLHHIQNKIRNLNDITPQTLLDRQEGAPMLLEACKRQERLQDWTVTDHVDACWVATREAGVGLRQVSVGREHRSPEDVREVAVSPEAVTFRLSAGQVGVYEAQACVIYTHSDRHRSC